MCLSTIEKLIPPNQEVGTAWKLVRKVTKAGELVAVRAPFRRDIYLLTFWNVSDEDEILYADTGETYPAGFHAWADSDSARAAMRNAVEPGYEDRYEIRQVELRDIRAIGYDHGFTTYVGKEMRFV